MPDIQGLHHSSQIKHIQQKTSGDQAGKVQKAEVKHEPTPPPIIANPEQSPKVEQLSQQQIKTKAEQTPTPVKTEPSKPQFTVNSFFEAIKSKTKLTGDEKKFLKTAGRIVAIAGAGTLALMAAGVISLPAIDAASIFSSEILIGLGGSLKGAATGALEGARIGGEILPQLLGESEFTVGLGNVIGSIAGGIYGLGSGLFNAIFA